MKWSLRPLWQFVRRASSRIAVRMLAFNVLLVFLPLAGLLYLDTYEQHLLEAQERSMVQQGRILAAALSDRETLDTETIDRLLRPLGQRVDARLRILDATGRVLGDTSRTGEPVESDPSPYETRRGASSLGGKLPTSIPPRSEAVSSAPMRLAAGRELRRAAALRASMQHAARRLAHQPAAQPALSPPPTLAAPPPR